MNVHMLALEVTAANRHWFLEGPIRIGAYLIAVVIARMVLHRMIDRSVARSDHPGRGDKRDDVDPEHVEGRQAHPRQQDDRHRRLQHRPDRVRALAAPRRTGVVGTRSGGPTTAKSAQPLRFGRRRVVGLGSAPLAIGFGAQNLVRDFVTGVFMLLEDQYGVGDIVDLGEVVGEVQSVGLRITTVRDLDGTLWFVRNGEIARVGNMSQDYAVARIEVPVALTADIETAEQVAVEAAEAAIAGKVLGEPAMLGVQELSPDLLKLRMTVKTHPNAQWAVQRRLRREILRAYNKHGIDLPYPRGRVHAIVGG